MNRASICAILAAAAFSAAPLAAQIAPAPDQDPTHDLSKVDVVTPGTAIATPLPPSMEKRLRKYDIPELAGARQALGAQTIDGHLRRPLVDYVTTTPAVRQRLSLFEGGLVVVSMTGGGTSVLKKLIIPPDALASYLKALAPERIHAITPEILPSPRADRRSTIRVYTGPATYVERSYDPVASLPKALSDEVMPLEDLLRAISEDRGVTNSVAGYEPKPGDELVGDDGHVYRVKRVVESAGIVELQSVSQPTILYVAKKDLYNYFVGAAPKAAGR